MSFVCPMARARSVPERQTQKLRSGGARQGGRANSHAAPAGEDLKKNKENHKF